VINVPHIAFLISFQDPPVMLAITFSTRAMENTAAWRLLRFSPSFPMDHLCIAFPCLSFFVAVPFLALESTVVPDSPFPRFSPFPEYLYSPFIGFSRYSLFHPAPCPMRVCFPLEKMFLHCLFPLLTLRKPFPLEQVV